MARRRLSEPERQSGRALGAAIAAGRRAADVTAEALARESGLSVDTIRKIEQGAVANPGIFTIDAVARRLGLGLDVLTESARSSAQEEER